MHLLYRNKWFWCVYWIYMYPSYSSVWIIVWGLLWVIFPIHTVSKPIFNHALLKIAVTSMLCFRIPGSPQAASTRTGDSSVYRVYEAYVQGQDRLLCICQPQRLPPLTTEKTYRCLTSPREPRSCVHKKHSVCQMRTYMICNSSQVHHSRFILCICIEEDVIRQHHICYIVKMFSWIDPVDFHSDFIVYMVL